MYWRIATLIARRTSSAWPPLGCRRPLRSPTNELREQRPVRHLGPWKLCQQRREGRCEDAAGWAVDRPRDHRRVHANPVVTVDPRTRDDHTDHLCVLGPHRERVREVLQHDPVVSGRELDLTDRAPHRPVPMKLHRDAVRQAGGNLGVCANDRVRFVTQVVQDDVVDEIVHCVAFERATRRRQTMPERSRRIVEHVEAIGFGDRVVPPHCGQPRHKHRR